jgi:diacylglycerol kinase family enzyme
VSHRSPARPGLRQRWLARLSLAAAIAAVVLLLVYGGLKSVTAVLLGAVGLGLIIAALWWFLAHRGMLRWLAGIVLVAAPAGILAVYVIAGLVLDVLVTLALAVISLLAARLALRSDHVPPGPPERATPPPRHAFLIMNPRSGGGKVGKFGLKDKAEGAGAEVELLEGPGTVDVAAMARDALDDGADLLGVAGGDGTQALVAGVAARADVPMMVLSAGTRNHFALDLGLDRDDPAAGLDALTDGIELRIDLGQIGGDGKPGRTFVNNASFGAYAEVVQSPAYRDDKAATALDMLPDLLSGHQGARLVVRIDGEVTLEGPQAVLVSNNPYETGDIAGLGRRSRLDQGVLGVVGVKVETGAQAAALLSKRLGSRFITIASAHEVVIDSSAPQIPVGIDGEAVLLPTPVRCTIQPRALRVRVPAGRPGVPPPQPELDWTRLRRQALTVGRASSAGHS